MYITPYKCIHDCSLRIHSNDTIQPPYQRGPHPLDVDIRWKRDYTHSMDTSSLQSQRASTQQATHVMTPPYRAHSMTSTRSHQIYQPRPLYHTDSNKAGCSANRRVFRRRPRGRPSPKQLRYPVLGRDRLSGQCRRLARSHRIVKSSPWSVRNTLYIPIQ